MQDKLKEAAQSFLDTNNISMLVKLVRKYPDAARIPLRDGSSLLSRALGNIDIDWPIFMAYLQGGGTFDGPSPTRGEHCQNWSEAILNDMETMREAYDTTLMYLTLLSESGIDISQESSVGRALVTTLESDIKNDVEPHEGLFALALKMGAKPGEGERSPVFFASTKYFGNGAKCEALLNFMREAGIDIQPRNEFGHTPMHMAIGAKNTGFIIGMVRTGTYLAEYMQTIRESEFSAKDIADIEAEWMDAQISTEKKEGVASDDENPAMPRVMISRRKV